MHALHLLSVKDIHRPFTIFHRPLILLLPVLVAQGIGYNQECLSDGGGHMCLPEDFFRDQSAAASLLQLQAAKPLEAKSASLLPPEPVPDALSLAATKEEVLGKHGRVLGEEMILKAQALDSTPSLAEALYFCNQTNYDNGVADVYYQTFGLTELFRQTDAEISMLQRVARIWSSAKDKLRGKLKALGEILEVLKSKGGLKKALKSLQEAAMKRLQKAGRSLRELFTEKLFLGVWRTTSDLCNTGLELCAANWTKREVQARVQERNSGIFEGQYGAICMYTTNAFYAAMNWAQRKEDESAVQYVKYLRLFIDSMLLLEEDDRVEEVYRGMSVDLCAERGDGVLAYKVQQDFGSSLFLADGDDFQDWQVVSTTTDFKIAEDFAKSGTIVTYKRTQARPLRVRDIEDFSVYGNEKERLLLPGGKFQVVGLERRATGVRCWVTLEQVSAYPFELAPVPVPMF